METPPLYPRGLEVEQISHASYDGAEADDEAISDSSETSSTSSWSELVSPDRSSFDEDDGDGGEYNEEEFLGILGLARQARDLYSTSHAVQDLEDSIAYLRDALTVAPTDNLVRADLLHMLAYDLYLFSQDGKGTLADVITESLNDSIRLHRQALKLLPSHHLSRALYITRLAIALRARCLQANTMWDLDECITLHRKAISLRPIGHPERPQSLLNLANAHWTRFEHTGNISDLDEAIKHDKETLELRPPGHSNRSAALASLVTDLTTRFRKTQRPSDLSQVIALQTEVLQLLEENGVRRNISHQLAAHLVVRYNTEGKREDLETAAKIIEGVRGRSGPAEDFLSLQILSEVYLALGEGLGDPDHLEKAVRLHRSCMEHLPNRPDIIIRFAYALTARFRRSHRLPDVEEAISLGTRALDLCSIGHPYRSASLRTIARTHRSRFEHLLDDKDLLVALDYIAQAAEDRHAFVLHRLACVEEWIELSRATTRHHSMLEAYKCKLYLLFVITCLPEDAVLSGGQDIPEFSSLGRDAALCALELGDTKAAIDLLERGRELVFAHALRGKSADILPADFPRRLLDVVYELGSVDASLFVTQSGVPVLEKPEEGITEADIHHNDLLAKEFDSLIVEAHKFRDHVQQDASHAPALGWNKGPIVFLVSGLERCEGLVAISSSTDPITQITLPLSPSALEDLSANFAECARVRDEAWLRRLLAIEWNEVVKPIVHALNFKKTIGQPRPRLWWCPTGSFAALPLHAAGQYDCSNITCISDYVTSSYAPTMRALYRAQMRNKSQSDRVLVVTSTSKTVAEDGKSHSIMSSRSFMREDVAVEMVASRHVLMKRAPGASILHLACSVTRHPSSLSQWSFTLADGQLTVSDLVSFGTHAPHLAFVDSSYPHGPYGPCKAADFYGIIMQGGFQSMVGTLWDFPERGEQSLAERFYGELFKTRPANFSTAAGILDAITCNLRERGAPFFQWVPYIHLGY